ncbi:hypothetical protein U9M48_027469, partial [Paspalum notatum var. saurae]
MSANSETSGSVPPPGSPPRTLVISLTVCVLVISIGILLVTPFVFYCRQRRHRGAGSDESQHGAPAALSGDRCGGTGNMIPLEAALPAAFSYASHDRDGEHGGATHECAVCLAAVKEGEMVRQLPACMHLYHVGCIDRWLAAHRTCPVCRSQLDSSCKKKKALDPLGLRCCRRRARTGGSEHSVRAAVPRTGGDRPFPVETLPPAFAYACQHGAAAACECAVCLGAVQDGEMVRRLPVCMHVYHADCIDRWLAAHRTCPLCRSELDPSKVVDTDALPPPTQEDDPPGHHLP